MAEVICWNKYLSFFINETNIYLTCNEFYEKIKSKSEFVKNAWLRKIPLLLLM